MDVISEISKDSIENFLFSEGLVVSASSVLTDQIPPAGLMSSVGPLLRKEFSKKHAPNFASAQAAFSFQLLFHIRKLLLIII